MNNDDEWGLDFSGLNTPTNTDNMFQMMQQFMNPASSQQQQQQQQQHQQQQQTTLQDQVGDNDPNSKKRKFVRNACTNCRKAHAKCDENLPCGRCVRMKLESSCTPAPSQKRGRKKRKEDYESNNSSASGPAMSSSSGMQFGSPLANTITSPSSSSSSSSSLIEDQVDVRNLSFDNLLNEIIHATNIKAPEIHTTTPATEQSFWINPPMQDLMGQGFLSSISSSSSLDDQSSLSSSSDLGESPVMTISPSNSVPSPTINPQTATIRCTSNPPVPKCAMESPPPHQLTNVPPTPVTTISSTAQLSQLSDTIAFLQRENQLLREQLQSNPSSILGDSSDSVGIFVTVKPGRIVSCNPYLTNMLGYDSSFLDTARYWHEIVHPLYWDAIVNKINMAFTHKSSVFDMENILLKKKEKDQYILAKKGQMTFYYDASFPMPLFTIIRVHF